MHEHAFIQSIIREIPEKNRDKITSIELELGELAGIEPEHLKQHMADETGWNISVEVKPSKIKCPSCSYTGKAEIKERLHDLVIFCCPECRSFNVDVLEGKDIKIMKITYSE